MILRRVHNVSLPGPKRLFNILEAVLYPEGILIQTKRPVFLLGSIHFLQSDVFTCVRWIYVTCTHPANLQRRDGQTSEAEKKVTRD